ncbi:MAG: tetraacyldisaccharide 4'-kinase [Pyrinomonadaceae bacterium]
MKKVAEQLFTPFGWLFGRITGVRRGLYQNGSFKSVDLGVPVVSVGNLTVGGTGKTPLVAFVAGVLAEKNHEVCILTRGYGRTNPNERVLVSDGKRILTDAQAAGDEPFELAHKLLGSAAVIADKNRSTAGIWARQHLGITAFVLDDGFQHLKIKRDLDIICIDATNPFGNEKLLPAGILREPLTSLRRADCVILTRTDLAEEVQSLKRKVQSFNQNCPILISKTQILRLTELKDFDEKPPSQLSEKSKIQNLKSKIGLAFCALGNPHGFFESLRQADFSLKTTKAFSDHYIYKQIDIDLIEKEAKANGAGVLLTTAKDAVKLRQLEFSLPCFVVEIEIVFEDGEPLLELLNAL